MESDLKKYHSSLDQLVNNKLPQGISMYWDIKAESDLFFRGKYIYDQAIISKQQLLVKNSNIYTKASISSQKIYKFFIEFYSQEFPQILPSIKIDLSQSNNKIMNLFSLAFVDKYGKALIGIGTHGVQAYGFFKYNQHLGTRAEFQVSLPKYDRIFLLECWWENLKYKFLFKKCFNGDYNGIFYYKTANSNEIALKLAVNNIFQTIIGIKYAISKEKVLRIQLDSEGLIGLRLSTVLSPWISIDTNSEVSVKHLAKNQNAFLGFGISLRLCNYKD